MKFSAAVVAICAATASAFSVTMSSTGYLSNLGHSGGLASFAPPAAASYGAPAPSYSYAPAPSPASYSAPAPAPQAYKSGFADLPASSSINYIGGLGGGSSMKPGKNYAGVSRSLRPTNAGSSYLNNLKGASMQYSYSAPAQPSYQSSYSQPAVPASYQSSYSPAPAPYQSSFASASAPAPANTGSYLDNLGRGGSSGSVSKSYSGMASSFARSTGQMAGATSAYLSNV